MAQNNISYLPVSVGQEPRCGLIGFSASGSPTGCIKVLAGAAVIRRQDWGQIHSKLTPMAISRIQFLAGCWPEAAPSSLPQGSLQHGSLHHESEQRRRESAREMEVTVFIT